jgi:hypothetical protein
MLKNIVDDGEGGLVLGDADEGVDDGSGFFFTKTYIIPINSAGQ